MTINKGHKQQIELSLTTLYHTDDWSKRQIITSVGKNVKNQKP